ncbi:MAG TPA: outer membrane beta-barrel protein, partial [Verrucomicrobiae bacterium]|nr:outer membrane beta-barrel protein [Verrucomicrobiae bacterium]
GNAALPGRAFDGVGKLDGFNLNVASLTIEKPLSEDQWAAGYAAQLIFGPDAVGYNVAVANGTTANNNSDFGVKQAYVALRTPIGNGIDWKIGTFNTIIGYESFESYLNPNYSRSFGWQLEPTQHTGLLGSYKFTDAVSVSLGVANTWSAGINARSPRAESHKAYMASITVTAPESWGFLKGSAWYAGVVEGFSGTAGTRDTANAYMGGSIATPVEGLSVGAAFDYRFNGPNTTTTASIVGQPDSNWAYAIAGYGSFQASEKWKLNARVDYTTGSDGTWFASPTGQQNELGAFTLTADYALWANVISRAEFRWDHSFNGDRPYGITDKNALTLAANVIYKF